MRAGPGRAWLVWSIAAGFYAYGFFQRVAPSVIVDDLMVAFALDATLLGTLSAAYFYTYAALQIPVGVLIDRFGPRLLLLTGAILAAVGGTFFALAGGLVTALLARGLIGAGVGVAYIATLKLVGAWFPLHRFGLLAGLTLAAGTAGAIGAQLPLALAVGAFGWRPVLLVVGIAALALAGLVLVSVRDRPPGAEVPGGTTPSATQALGLVGMLARRETWMLVLITGFTGAPVLAFAGLWGVPYLVHVHGLDRTAAASLTSVMLVSWAIGGPALGALADRLGRRSSLILAIAAAHCLLWLPFVLVPDLSLGYVVPLTAALGFGGGGMIVAFAVVRSVFGVTAAGRALGIVNSAVLLVGAGMQTAFGAMLDARWDGATSGGTRLYDAAAYSAGFVLCVAAAAIVVLAGLGLRAAERQHDAVIGR
ncbi:MAG: MFS transporter [Geminicoccaceae bacterium]